MQESLKKEFLLLLIILMFTKPIKVSKTLVGLSPSKKNFFLFALMIALQK